jgi:hypothetical protein
MSDENQSSPAPLPEPVPAPAPEPSPAPSSQPDAPVNTTDDLTINTPGDLAVHADNVKIDAENILHDGERSTRHKLAHLEEEFFVELNKFATYTKEEADKLLAWLSSRI